MTARAKEVILLSYRNGEVQSNKDIFELAIKLNISFSEIYKFLCKQAAKGTPCEGCIYIGTNKCALCSRSRKTKDYYQEKEL